MLDIAKVLATGLGVGYSKIAPGTMGALLASVFLFLYLYFLGIPSTLSLVISSVVLYILGWWSVDIVHKIWPHDDNRIVIDEILGIIISLMFIPLSAASIILAFILFRIFDIWKPLGIRSLEKIGGAHGVLIDDVLAGVYANLILQLLIYLDIVPWL